MNYLVDVREVIDILIRYNEAHIVRKKEPILGIQSMTKAILRLSRQPQMVKVDDLRSFIEKEKDKENRTLADWVVQWILEKIIDGDCKITGSATDHDKKKMYVEFSFYQKERDSD